MSSQPTLWEVPSPPSGPQTDVRKFTREAGTHRAYVWWRTETEEGRRVFAYVERCALTEAARGETRISIRTLAEQARMRLKIEMNDHYSPWMADDLLARHPHLIDLVERRRRRVTA